MSTQAVKQVDNSPTKEARAAMDYLRQGADYLAKNPIKLGKGSKAIEVNKVSLLSWMYPAGMKIAPLHDLVYGRGIDVADVAVAVSQLRLSGKCHVDIEGCEVTEIEDVLQDAVASRMPDASGLQGTNVALTRYPGAKITIRALGVPRSGKGKSAGVAMSVCPWGQEGGQADE